MKILMVASESVPYIKTGGLADVVYSLAKELSNTEEVSVILPLYKQIKEKHSDELTKVIDFTVTMSWRKSHTVVYELMNEKIHFYFIDNPQYFNRNNIYGDFDDGERFAFFDLAVAEFLSQTYLIPDIIHIHDWQTGMLPCIIKENEYYRNVFINSKFIYTIHNPAFQGILDRSALGDLFNLPDYLYDNGNVRFRGMVSTLKTGIMYADKLTTVSPRHRYELLKPGSHMGFDTVLRYREYDFYGILNGIDYEEFNPKTDKHIPYQYNGVNVFKAKKLNKEVLCSKLGITDFNKPLFGFVSRLTWQKGMDILFPTIERLAALGNNLVLLGSGEARYEQQLEALRSKYPNNVAIYIGYSDELAHQIYAACDFYLMPSLFEPCGLSQMIAMRYGTLPIVRRTGGLRDSVINYDNTNAEVSNGFGFDAYDTYEMINTVDYALECFKNDELRKKLIRNAMKSDNSWQKSEKEYLKLYKKSR